ARLPERDHRSARGRRRLSVRPERNRLRPQPRRRLMRLSRTTKAVAAGALAALLAAAPALAQSRGIQPAPDRKPGEGAGPFKRLIIRGATMIDGTGAPPMGPVDIVIEGNR